MGQKSEGMPEAMTRLVTAARGGVLHVTNYGSTLMHGGGQKLTIMVRPRHWERVDGYVPLLLPRGQDLVDVKHGRMPVDEYRATYERALSQDWVMKRLMPGALDFTPWGSRSSPNEEPRLVESGATLLCCCSRDAARRNECHRVWAARLLKQAGWTVHLDGVLL